MKTNAKLLGSGDEQTTCDCCGKQNLKLTVALEIDGAVVRFGRDCAGRALLGSKSAKNSSIVENRSRAVNLAKRLFGTMEDVKVSDAVGARFGFGMEIRQGVARFAWGTVSL